MDQSLVAMCGDYCGNCEYREKMNCPTCRVVKGRMFWGTCDVAVCCSGKGLQHCGLCDEMPCEKLQAVFANPEHGDNGERLANLKAWAQGETTVLKIGTFPKEGGSTEA